MSRQHRHHDERAETGRGHHPLRRRPAPFVSLLATAWVVVPALGTVAYIAGLLDPSLRILVVIVVMSVTSLLAGAAVFIGWKVTKRIPFVYWHVAFSLYVFGVALSLFAGIGWNKVWIVIYYVCSAGLAGSWMLYRIDALRSDPRQPGEQDDTWGKLFGVPRAKVGRASDTEFHRRARVELGPGETLDDLQSAGKRIESAAGAMRGRTLVLPDPDHPDDAGRAEVSLMFRDPLRVWPAWPGPSAPGGCFTEPTCQGVYEDGEPEVYWHAAGVDAHGDPRSATHIGVMGITRSGKTGGRKVALVDGVLTRRNAVLLYADATKGLQSAAPLLGGVALYADTKPKARLLFGRVQQLVRDRADLMGRYGYSDWSPAVYDDPRLRLPAVVYHIDEADELIGNDAFKWLCTKGLSAGVYVSVTLPRADHESMPTTARGAIGMWQCFGVGDDYSAGFALTDSVVAAGAHPEEWGNTKPGYHYLAGAPGVVERRYSMTARTYRASDKELAAAVAAGATYRATPAPTDLVSLRGGRDDADVLTICDPANARQPGGATTTGATTSTATPDGDAYDDEGDDMPEVDYERPRLPDATPTDEAAYDATDARQPIPAAPGPNREFPDDRPRAASAEAAAAAFDELLREMAAEDRGSDVVDVAEFVDRFPLRGDSWMSKRLSQVADGAVVAPPGITLERVDDGDGGFVRGKYRLTRLRPGPESGDVR